MATIDSATFRKNVPNGTYGTLVKTDGKADLSATVAGTVVRVLRLEAGTKMFGLKAHAGALGAGTSIKVGVAYFNAADGTDDDDLFGTLSTASAGKLTWDDVPVVFNVPVAITVTTVGGATTGSVTVIPEYEYRGV